MTTPTTNSHPAPAFLPLSGPRPPSSPPPARPRSAPGSGRPARDPVACWPWASSHHCPPGRSAQSLSPTAQGASARRQDHPSPRSPFQDLAVWTPPGPGDTPPHHCRPLPNPASRARLARPAPRLLHAPAPERDTQLPPRRGPRAPSTPGGPGNPLLPCGGSRGSARGAGPGALPDRVGEPQDMGRNASQVGRAARRAGPWVGGSSPVPGRAPAAPSGARRLCAPRGCRSLSPAARVGGSGVPGRGWRRTASEALRAPRASRGLGHLGAGWPGSGFQEPSRTLRPPREPGRSPFPGPSEAGPER